MVITPFNKTEYLQRWFDKLNTPQDTTELQGQALSSFLLELGYEFEYNLKDKSFHIRRIGKSDNPEYMSIKDAVTLYNLAYHLSGLMGLPKLPSHKGFTFSEESYNKAYSSKLVSRVYLRREKGNLGVSSHWVKFNLDMVNNGE